MISRRLLSAFGLGLAALGAASLLTAAPSTHIVSGADFGPRFDLSQLADGETRTFGEGEHQLSATRSGNDVTVTLPAREGAPRTIHCTVGTDSCFVMSQSDEGRTMVLLEKDGADGEKTAEATVIVARSADANGSSFSWTSGDDDKADGEVRIVRTLSGPEGTLLRCPKGDTTMHLDKEDRGAYTCPKHGLGLEKVDGSKLMRKVIVHTSDEKSPEAKTGN